MSEKNILKNKKVAFLTLGCKVNQYETDAMIEILKKYEMDIVPFDETADIYIINTCSVTNIADRKSRQMINRAKKNNEDSLVIAVGCYVQAKKDEVEKEQNVDIIIGNNKKKDIAKILEKYYTNNNQEKIHLEEIIDINKTNEYEELSLQNVNEHTRAYIKIQDGCNQFCSYCIIPYTRGRVRSRKKSDIIAEVENLAKKGFKEIVLTGIHLSSYGIDLENTSLLDLITSLNDIDGLLRIRLGSLEPRIITEEFVESLSKIDKICPHFHLSLQSGCDDTLKRMNRKYNTNEYKLGCDILRKYFDNPAITTDIIVGFPKETEEEFNQTKEYLEKINLYEMHIFKYSRRKGTLADKMPGQVKDQDKSKRSDILLKMSSEHKKNYHLSFINKDVKVLVEEKVKINDIYYYVGYTDRYIKVAFESDKDLKNKIVIVNLQKELENGMLLGILN